MADNEPTIMESKYGTYQVEKLTGLRKIIATKLTLSDLITTKAGHGVDLDMTVLYKAREYLQESGKVKLPYDAFFIKAAAYALKKEPRLNTTIHFEGIENPSLEELSKLSISELLDKKEYHTHDYCNIGYAVDLAGKGLVVLNMKNADKKSLLEISHEIYEKAKKLKEKGKPSDIEDIQGGTFTINNVGALNRDPRCYVTDPDPILNTGEVAILALGSLREEIAIRRGKIVINKGTPAISYKMAAKLAFDHSWLDGGEAARFMDYFTEFLNSREKLINS